MILCAALRLKIQDIDEYIVLPCHRHHDGFHILKDLEVDHKQFKIDQGFITTKNEYLNRADAYNHAKECGQLPIQLIVDKERKGQNELYSEDLY